jgi:hypothetical protein
MSFYTMPQYEAWKEAKPPGAWDIKYYKVRGPSCPPLACSWLFVSLCFITQAWFIESAVPPIHNTHTMGAHHGSRTVPALRYI